MAPVFSSLRGGDPASVAPIDEDANSISNRPPSGATMITGEVVGLIFLTGMVCCVAYIIIRFCRRCCKGDTNSTTSSGSSNNPCDSSAEWSQREDKEEEAEVRCISFNGPAFASCPVLQELEGEEIEMKEMKNGKVVNKDDETRKVERMESGMITKREDGNEDKETGEYCRHGDSSYEVVYENEVDMDGKVSEGCKKEDQEKKQDDKEEGEENCHPEVKAQEGLSEDCKSEGPANEEENKEDGEDVVDNPDTNSWGENENNTNSDAEYYWEIGGYGRVNLELLEDALREEEPVMVEESSSDPEENPFLERKTESNTSTQVIEYPCLNGNLVVTYNPQHTSPIRNPALTDIIEDVNALCGSQQEQEERRTVVQYSEPRLPLTDSNSSMSEVDDSGAAREADGTMDDSSDDDSKADDEEKVDETKEDKGDEKENKEDNKDYNKDKDDKDKEEVKDEEKMAKDKEDYQKEESDDKNEEHTYVKKIKDGKDETAEDMEGGKEDWKKEKDDEEEEGPQSYIFFSCDEGTDDELLEEGRHRPACKQSPVRAEALSGDGGSLLNESGVSLYYTHYDDNGEEDVDDELLEMMLQVRRRRRQDADTCMPL